MPDLENATLAPQSYGIAMAQGAYGGPRGIWLECTQCDRSDVIKGSGSHEWQAVPNAAAAEIFRKHGWTGEGTKMTGCKCPDCSRNNPH